jgi:hypothetical protein
MRAMRPERIIRPAPMNPDLLATMVAVLLGCFVSGALGFLLGR